MGQDHRKTAGSQGMLTERFMFVPTLAEGDEEGVCGQGLSDRADLVDPMLGIFRVHGAGFRNP